MYYVYGWMGSHLDSLAEAWAITAAAAAAKMKVVRIFFMDKGARLLVEILNTGWCPREIPESGVVISC